MKIREKDPYRSARAHREAWHALFEAVRAYIEAPTYDDADRAEAEMIRRYDRLVVLGVRSGHPEAVDAEV